MDTLISTPPTPAADAPETDWDGRTHTDTPQPASTHSGTDDVQPPEPIAPAAQSTQEPLKLLYWVGLEKREWLTSEKPPTDAESLMALRVALSTGSARFSKPINQKIYLGLVASIREAWAPLENVPEAPIANITVHSDRVRHVGRAEGRADLIAKLDALLAGDDLEKTPVRVHVSNELISRALADTDDTNNSLRLILHVARRNIAEYSRLFWQLWPVISFQDRQGEIKTELLNISGMSPERIEALREELAKAESSSAEIVADAANARLVEAFTPVREIIDHALENLISVLGHHKDAAVTSEKLFFDRNGVAYEQTSVSRRYDKLIADLRKQLELRRSPQQSHVSRNHPIHPDQADPVFVIEILPAQ